MNPSWEQFVQTHAKSLLTSAYRILLDANEAEDVAQDVLLEIFQSGKIHSMADQPGLIRTIATRRALDRIRRRKTWVPLSGVEVPSPDHEPHRHAEVTELDQLLRRSLSKLSPRESEVFCLVYFEGLSHEQIGIHLQISKQAVAKSLSLARGKLEKTFSRHSLEARS